MANSVVVKIDGDDSGFKKSLSGIGSVAKKGLGVAVKGIAATSAALGGLSAVAIKSYAQYEQLIGGVDTLFKTSSEAVQKNAAKAYKTAGLSANEYMETAMSFAASLKQSFDDTEEGLEAAAKAADQAVIDMSDNANKMGTDMGLIQNAYQGFAKQNYTMLDNLKLGYGGTKTEMERLLKDAEKLSGIKYDISNLADVYEAIHVIQTELGITGTTAKEASETISGSIGMMSASWQNLVTGFANGNADLDSLMQEFLDSVLIVGKNLIPTIETTLSGVGKFISGAAKTLVPQIVDIIISTLPGLVSAAVELVKALGDAIIKNAPKLLDAAKEIVNILIEGIESAIPALKPFTSLLKGLTKNFEAVAISVGAVTTALFLYNTVGKATKTLTTAWTTATAALNAMEQAHAITLMASNGGLTLFQTLVGLVTGKITLQTAATGLAAKAQIAFNAAMTANPVGLVLVAVVALTAGIYGLYRALNQETEAERQHRIALEELNQEINDNTEAIKQRKEAMAEEASESVSSLSHTEALANELMKLADEEGNVAEAEQGRAKFILGELNKALGTEYEMVDGQIKKYEDLKTSIYELIEAKKIESLSNTAGKYYDEALAERNKLADDYAKICQTANPILAEQAQLQEAVNDAEAEYNRLLNTDTSKMDTGELQAHNDALADANLNLLYATNALEKFETKNKETLTSYDNAKAALDENTAAIARYEEAMALAAEGKTDEAISKLMEYTSAAESGTLSSQKFAEGTAENLAQLGTNVQRELVKYQSALEEYNKTGSATAKAAVENQLGVLNGAISDYMSAGGSAQYGYIDGFNIAGKHTKININPILSQISGLEGKFQGEGWAIGGAFSKAVADSSTDVTTATATMGTEAVESLEVDTYPSGQMFVDGYINAIKDGYSPVYTAACGLGRFAHSGLKAGQQEGSPSKLTRKSGGYFSQGFALGITGGKKDVEKAGKNIALAAAHSIEKPLGIHSLSVYMKDKVGLMITKGMAIGIKEGSGEVSKEFEKLFADLELQRDLDAISEEEYYERLTELRDKYLKAGTKEWWDYTQEIIDYNNELKDQVIEQMEDVLDKQEDFAKQLDKMSKLASEKTVTNPYGKEMTVYELTNWEEQNARIKGYGTTLDHLGERLKAAFGGATDEYFELMQTIRDGGLEEGLWTATLLLDLNDTDLQKYVDGFVENRKLVAQEARDQYAEEMQSVALSVDVDVDFDHIKQELEAKFGELPPEFFDVGADSADEFGSGFLESLDAVLKEGRHKIDTMMSGAFFADTSGGSSASVVYNNTYVVQPAEGESTQKQLKEIRDSETMNKMRGGY